MKNSWLQFIFESQIKRCVCKICRIAHNYSALDIVSKCLTMVASNLYTEHDLLVFVLARGDVQGIKMDIYEPMELIFAEIDSHNVEKFGIAHPGIFYPERLQKVRDRLNDGNRLFLIKYGRHIVHTSWLRTAQVPVIAEIGDDFPIPLDGPVSIIYECVTHRNFRRKGIYFRNLLYLSQISEFDNIMIYCKSSNIASMEGIKKAGFKLKWRANRRVYFRMFTRASVIAVNGNNDNVL